MEDVTARKAELFFEIEWRERRATDDAGAEIGRVIIDRVDDELGGRIAHAGRVPAAIDGIGSRKVVVEVLTEETRDVRAPGCERVVESRGDQHLDDGFARDTV
ncbi:MAG: hypothetical protein EB102_09265 [Gammaproteobacteria bacterium]|nr:hypothetical protein [Gammaproteobacteria bacterium]